MEENSEKKRKPCIVFIGDLEKITNKFLKKGFIEEKRFLRGAVRSFTYSLGYKTRLHVRIFEEDGKYSCYGHTEPKPLSDPLFHLKGAIAGSVAAQRTLNIIFGVSKVASDLLQKVKPKNGGEDLSQEEQTTKENIENIQKITNSLPYFPEEKAELADYEEGCRVLRDLFSEYVKK
ncbi:MAG: hypothetical protein ACFFCM_14260 [Promethearchaeota archaeon]